MRTRVIFAAASVFALSLACAPAAESRDSAPAVAAGVKVVSEKNPDASSIEALFKDIFKPGMTDQQKAEAIFYYMVRHSYHHDVPEEPCADNTQGRKGNSESSKIMDAVKSLNVYGHAICGSIAWPVNLLHNAAGLKGRISGIEGHNVPEVFYDGKWHFTDIDQMGFIRRKDGTIPSIDDVKADKSLLFEKNDNTPDIFFKYDGAAGEYESLRSGVLSATYGRKVSAHSMNLTLREGESLTRFFQRQWAPRYRYYSAPWPGSAYMKRLSKNKGQGPQRGETFYLFKEGPAARFGNWEMIYAPPLAKPSCLDGAFALANVVHSATPPFLRPKQAGAAEVIYNFYSPYGCAGAPNVFTNAADDADGAIVEGEFVNGKGAVAYSLDLGKSWKEVHQGGGAFKLDLTPQLEAHYGWLLKLSFEGEGSGLKSFKSYIAGQLSPASLPFVDGQTKMTFARANTACLLFAPDVTDGEAELKRLAHGVRNFASFSGACSGHVLFQGGDGDVVFKVQAPNDIVRVQTGAKFGCRKAATLNGISFSIDDGKSWILACQQPVMAAEPDHPEDYWGQSVDGALDFDLKKAFSYGCTPGKDAVRESPFAPRPVKSVLVKFHTRGGDGKLIQLYGIYVHYKQAGSQPLTITHRWKGGEHVEKIGAGETEKSYVVNGGPLASNESITLEAGAKR